MAATHRSGAWVAHAEANPTWISVTPEELTDPAVAADVERVLANYYGATVGKPHDIEDTHWTQHGPPGTGPDIYTQAGLPTLTALFTNDGRNQQALNYGGGQVGATGQATASSSTTLTTTYTSSSTTQWTGYRLYATVSATQLVWGNVVSCTSGANAVFTVDRWYTVSTPGGAAGSTPSSTATWVLADGGMVSAWFCGLTATVITPAATDHTLSGEITTGGGGLIRKICPFAITSGTSPLTLTLTPVFTANGSDSLPVTVAAAAFFTSMVTSFGGTNGPMKFEGLLSATATFNISGDQMTLTETITGS